MPRPCLTSKRCWTLDTTKRRVSTSYQPHCLLFCQAATKLQVTDQLARFPAMAHVQVPTLSIGNISAPARPSDPPNVQDVMDAMRLAARVHESYQHTRESYPLLLLLKKYSFVLSPSHSKSFFPTKGHRRRCSEDKNLRTSSGSCSSIHTLSWWYLCDCDLGCDWCDITCQCSAGSYGTSPWCYGTSSHSSPWWTGTSLHGSPWRTGGSVIPGRLLMVHLENTLLCTICNFSPTTCHAELGMNIHSRLFHSVPLMVNYRPLDRWAGQLYRFLSSI